MSGTFPSSTNASDLLAASAPALQDLEKSKDHLVNAAAAAASASVL